MNIIWSDVNVPCPMCRHPLRIREVGRYFTVGQDSDLLTRMANSKMRHAIELEITMCHFCGYCGLAKDFFKLQTIEARNAFLTNHPYTELKISYFEKYRKAFISNPLLDRYSKAMLMVRAHWCTRLSHAMRYIPQREREGQIVIHRANAIKYLSQFVDKEELWADEGEDRRSAKWTRGIYSMYLLAELHRRHGNFENAIHYFDKFMTLIFPNHYLHRAAGKLRALADGDIEQPLSMEEVLYEQEETK